MEEEMLSVKDAITIVRNCISVLNKRLKVKGLDQKLESLGLNNEAAIEKLIALLTGDDPGVRAYQYRLTKKDLGDIFPETKIIEIVEIIREKAVSVTVRDGTPRKHALLIMLEKY
jgi:hypothetical protein